MHQIHIQLDRLEAMGVRYAFHYQPAGQETFSRANCERFPSASIIKVPILLAWLLLERAGEIDRGEVCDLDGEPQVQGAGFSWLLRARRLPFQDVLLMMIALSDNLCTNLVIRRIGLERLNRIIQEELDLPGCSLERKLFDYEARARGQDNWISAGDCRRLYQRLAGLPGEQLAWAESILEVNQDDNLLKRGIPHDVLSFFHKTGSNEGVLHDWGYTRACQVFLLTSQVKDDPAVVEVFGELGRLTIGKRN